MKTEDHWVGMPEFKQEKKEPFSKIMFRFETEQDLKDFEKLIGQPLTAKTKSAWFPRLNRGKNSGLRYVNEDNN